MLAGRNPILRWPRSVLRILAAHDAETSLVFFRDIQDLGEHTYIYIYIHAHARVYIYIYKCIQPLCPTDTHTHPPPHPVTQATPQGGQGVPKPVKIGQTNAEPTLN